MKQIISIFISMILLTSCNGGSNDEGSLANPEMKQEMAPVAGEADAQSPPVEKPEVKSKIIKDGRLGLQVTDLQKTKVHVDAQVKIHGGYYANESFINTDWESAYNLKVRIPSANFEKFIAAVETGNVEVLYKEIDARDVTDQFIDLETRLENKRNYLNRYNELLKQAKTIKEILEIEEKIRVLEEEIESTTGRLKYLSDLVDHSTLDLTISKRNDFKYNPADRAKFSERIKQSLSQGWIGFVDFLLFAIRIWPFWIIVAFIVYFWRRYKRTRNKN